MQRQFHRGVVHLRQGPLRLAEVVDECLNDAAGFVVIDRLGARILRNQQMRHWHHVPAGLESVGVQRAVQVLHRGEELRHAEREPRLLIVGMRRNGRPGGLLDGVERAGFQLRS